MSFILMGNELIVATSINFSSLIQYMPVYISPLGLGLDLRGRSRGEGTGAVGLTRVQPEHELDRVVVEVAAVLDDLDEGGQAALA